MSQVYMTEPQTTGRVVLTTTHGPIDINLWCRECPTTCRAFLQLCIDGYFDGMIFHRILNDFLIQTGLTRSTSARSDLFSDPPSEQSTVMDTYMKQHVLQEHRSGGRPVTHSQEMEWLGRKKLELSPRIKFNHRGQVALALPLDTVDGKTSHLDESDVLQALLLMRQFFVTLSEASFLNLKHVIFGTVSGPTIFNAIRIGKAEVDDQGFAPDFQNCPKILSVKIDFHPFNLVITKNELVPWKRNQVNNTQTGQEIDMKQRRKQRKGKRDVNVLSFGDQVEEDHHDSGFQSIHDVLHQPPSKNKPVVPKDTGNHGMEKVSNVESHNNNQTSTETNHHPIVSTTIQNDLSTSNSHKRHEDETMTNSSIIESRRAKYLYLKRGALQQDSMREEETLSKLLAFRNKVSALKTNMTADDEVSQQQQQNYKDDSLASRMALRLARQQEAQEQEQDNKKRTSMTTGETYVGQILETKVNPEAGSWMKTNFQCKRHVDTDTVDEYQVIDSRPSDKKGKKGKHPLRSQ